MGLTKKDSRHEPTEKWSLKFKLVLFLVGVALALLITILIILVSIVISGKIDLLQPSDWEIFGAKIGAAAGIAANGIRTLFSWLLPG